MGIYDRDYARTPKPQLLRGGRGRFRLVSVNTWLIVINVAVFALGLVLQQTQLANIKVSAGSITFNGTRPEQIARSIVDKTRQEPIPGSPQFRYHPRVDPQSVMTDQFGRPLVNLMDGKPIPQIIGRERFMFRPLLDGLGHFSTGKAFLELQVWRFLTFQFLHVDGVHLLFNMLGLWFVGGVVEEFLGRRRYLAFYLACGIFGAIAYLLLNLLGYIVLTNFPGLRAEVPALLFDDIFTPLVGASAGVFGVLLAAAFIEPKTMVQVLFVIPMRMRTAVYIFVTLAALNLILGGRNAGGDAAHIGGAAAGALLIRRTHLLRDFFDVFGDSRKGSPGRRSAKASQSGPSSSEIERVLKKVDSEGLQSLTDSERAVLKRARESST